MQRIREKLSLRRTFSLASVFALITISTFWFALGIRKSQSEAALADAFARCEGNVGIVFDPPRRDDKWIGLGRDTTDQTSVIRQIFNLVCHDHFPKIRHVSFNYEMASDELFQCLARAPYLDRVTVDGHNDCVVAKHRAVAKRVSHLRPDVVVDVWSGLPEY